MFPEEQPKVERNKAFWAGSKAISKATWTLQSRVHLIQPSLIWLFIFPSGGSEVWEIECQMTWEMTEFRSQKSQLVKGQLRVHLPIRLPGIQEQWLLS